jgi:hypothetical protein
MGCVILRLGLFSGSVKYCEFLDQLSDRLLIRKNYAVS